MRSPMNTNALDTTKADTKPAKKTRKKREPLPPVHLTAEQAAQRLCVTQMTLRRWRAAGRLPVLRVGPRRIVYCIADVENYERQSRA